ncbi:GNAT family N-acetyltransferase [Candidatus Uhrbacteria bacterium]|nr:GNAT family N-acetyltransferase [Candidatus Uhrbacteria bacterium]
MTHSMDNAWEQLEAHLRLLRGAEVRRVSDNSLAITILQHDDWNKHIKQLKDHFWPLIKEAYQREDDELERQLRIDFENAKKVYCEINNGMVIGFCSIEQDSNDTTLGIVRDIIVQENERGKKIGEKLYSCLFSDQEWNAVIGASLNFAAIKTRIRVSEQHGYKGYYGPQGTGNELVEKLRRRNLEYMTHEDLIAELPVLPPHDEGYVFLKPDVLLPFDPKDLEKLDSHSEFYSIAQEILRLQELVGQDVTVAGHLINVRQRKNAKE